MSSAAVPPRFNVAVASVSDTVERKAERLWGLEDAEKPPSTELPDMGLVRVSALNVSQVFMLSCGLLEGGHHGGSRV